MSQDNINFPSHGCYLRQAKSVTFETKLRKLSLALVLPAYKIVEFCMFHAIFLKEHHCAEVADPHSLQGGKGKGTGLSLRPS